MSARDWSWFTAKELAELKLPGLPLTKSGIIRRADEKGWQAEERPTRGGPAKHYHIASLPREAQAALRKLQREQSAETFKTLVAQEGGDVLVREIAAGRAEGPLGTAAAKRLCRVGARTAPRELDEAGILRRDARLYIVNMYKAFRLRSGLSDTTAWLVFTSLYNAADAMPIGDTHFSRSTFNGAERVLQIPAWVRKSKARISTNALRDWIALVDAGRPDALAGNYGVSKGSSIFDLNRGLHDFVTGALLKTPDITMGMLKRAIEAEFGDSIEIVLPSTGEVKARPVPHEKTIGTWVAAWKAENAELFKRETDPDGWKSGWKQSLGKRGANVTRVNQEWEIDASPTDVLLNDGRYCLYAIVDVFSRRAVIVVTRTASTHGALLAVRKAIELWGRPEVIRTDNGSDFVSDEFKRAMMFLGIVQDVCDVGAPDQKPFVERFFKTLQHGFMPLLPGYIGHSVADRKKIEGRKAFLERLGQSERDAFCIEMDRDALQHRLDGWASYIYAHDPHDGLKGRTPFEVAQSCTAKRIEMPADALYILLAPAPKAGDRPAGLRTVTAQGVKVEAATFWDPDNRLRPYMRKEVFVRMDPDDMGKVWVFTADHAQFICEAINWDRLGESRPEMVAKAKAAEKEYLAGMRAEARRVKARFKPHLIADKIREKAEKRAAAIVQFPKQTETADTPAIRAAVAAMAARDQAAAPPPEVQEVDRVAHSATIADFDAARRKREQPKEHEPRDQFRRWLVLDARLKRGDPVDETDRRWWAAYQSTSEYRGLSMVYREFGEAALGGE